ncbi:NINE protein [Leptospira stimsonii]|uniref:NINE protein n=1 Tax=Leptospira stimsonii TaxID=2202203 RepID=A0ABY2N355_9LEPT|nr:NINE protein [Leptospira stimsonii]TGK26081.1 NINE protein [Leptospira stimsonii]TGM14909.1 NINE protein [Leptospira stimsonii]
MKSKGTAYLFWFIGFGLLGLHRFYLGKVGTGIIWLCTGGFFLVGAIMDFFTLGSQVDAINTKKELKEIRIVTLANAVAQKGGEV